MKYELVNSSVFYVGSSYNFTGRRDFQKEIMRSYSIDPWDGFALPSVIIDEDLPPVVIEFKDNILKVVTKKDIEKLSKRHLIF